MPPKASDPRGQSILANKRKDPNKPDNGWQNKRVKIRDDREIVTQHPELALKDGELDLQKFLSAHEYSIKALEESMRHTKSASSTRAFQMVPRGLRRRTASHNAKRVPKRLRRKALKEMDDDNTPTVTQKRRPRTTRARIRAETAKKLGILAEKSRKRKLKAAREREKKIQAGEMAPEQTKSSAAKSTTSNITTRVPRPKIRRNQLNDPPKAKSKFRKRQIHKTWLPSHLWHAKRARMTSPKEPLWRFAVPLTPNEKIYRATHRAQGEKGAMAWDMSYVSTIGLYGNQRGIEQVLRKLGVHHESCWNARGDKWRLGTRHWTGFLSRPSGKVGLRRMLCPATILWNPESPKADATMTDADGDVEEAATATRAQRQLFIRVHPSAFLELFNELLRLVKMQTPKLYIEDLRFEIGSIELTGPAATETLLGILDPYPAKKDRTVEQHAQLFNHLNSETNPASLPPNALLAFSVLDPRLRYPPRKVSQPDLGDPKQQQDMLDLLAQWPAEHNLKPHGMFSRDARFQASRLPSQRSVDKRKGAKTPGSFLDAGPNDPAIPIILLATRSNARSQGGWTLLAPFKCIQPIWYSLVHFPLTSGGNPRFGGLNEARQVPFERGLPCFPFDHLGTDSGAEWELQERAKRKEHWDRRPKSKKTAWKSLELGAGRKGEIGDGLACDLEHLFGIKGKQTSQEQEKGASQADGTSGEMEVDDDASGAERAQKGKKPPTEPLKLVHQMPKNVFNTLVTQDANPSDAHPANSIITAHITLTTRGVVSPCARIYRLPSRPEPIPPAASAEVPASAPPPRNPNSSRLPADLRDQWLAKLPGSTSRSTSRPQQNRQHQQPPPQRGTIRVPADADETTRKRMLAQALLPSDPPPSWSALTAKPNQTDMNGHPLVPDEGDLIGFVTTGEFCLSEGRATAVGSIAVDKVLDGVRCDRRSKETGKGKSNNVKNKKAGGVDEGTLCIVRNAGESVGWLARWEAV